MRTFILTLLFGISVFSAIAQGVITLKPYYRYHYIFESGYWVYRDTLSNHRDSVVLENVVHGYISPNPVFNDYQEYFTLNYFSYYSGLSFNHFFITEYWKYNGGGEYGQYGQPLMYIQQFGNYPVIGSLFNGCEIPEVLPALTIDGTVYQDVIHSHIYENLQYQHEFDDEIDFFIAPNVGIIRKVVTDSLGIREVWDLQQHQAVPYTGIENTVCTPGPEVYPNPAGTVVHIAFPGLTSIEICDTQGRTVVSKPVSGQRIALAVNALEAGSYVLLLHTPFSSFRQKLLITGSSQ